MCCSGTRMHDFGLAHGAFLSSIIIEEELPKAVNVLFIV